MWNQNRFAVLDEEDQFRAPVGTETTIKRELTCDRCGCQRFDYYSRYSVRSSPGYRPFLRMKVVYKYPTGYKFVGAEHMFERPDASDFFMEAYLRFRTE